MKRQPVLAVLVTLMVPGALGACSSSEPVNIGDDNVEALGEKLSDYAGTWEGYAEVHQFDDGTDTIRLTLDSDGAGELEVGNAEPLPPPEVDQPYPPVESVIDLWLMPGEGNATLISGFGYPVSDARVESRRLRVETTTRELIREWCESQTLHLVQDVSPTQYACRQWTGFGIAEGRCYVGGSATMDGMEIDCGKLACVRACKCDETSCGIDETHNVQLDATLQADGDELRGSLLIDGELINIQLTRM